MTKPPAQFFDWATELSDAQGHVTLSEQEAHEIGARLRSMGEKLKAYEDLDGAASDVQLLRMGYAAARLEIESLKAQLAERAKEHADELAVAYMCGASREKGLAAPQPSPSAASKAVLAAIRAANMQLVRTGDDAFMLATYKQATPQPAPQQEPSYTAVQLAELVLSDCGHSSNYTPLLDRVAARIDSHVERRLDELRRCLESKPAPQQEAHHLTQALTDPENQPNQYGAEFGMSGQQMHFKIGNQLFRLAYEPDDQEEFEFMKRMLINAFSTFTPDVKTAPPAGGAGAGGVVCDGVRSVAG